MLTFILDFFIIGSGGNFLAEVNSIMRRRSNLLIGYILIMAALLIVAIISNNRSISLYCIAFITTPLLLPIGILLFKSKAKNKTDAIFSSLLSRLPEYNPKRHRNSLCGQEKQLIYHRSAEATIMTIPFFIFSLINYIILDNWIAATGIFGLIACTTLVYYYFSCLCLGFSDFYIYTKSDKVVVIGFRFLKAPILLSAIAIWSVVCTVFYMGLTSKL